MHAITASTPAATVSSTTMTGPLGALPDHLIVRIFSNLDKVSEVSSLGQTCKRLFDISTDELGFNPCKVYKGSHYLPGCLERNLKILKEIRGLLNLVPLKEQNFIAAKQLAKTLHPDFQDRMKDHRPAVGSSSFFSGAGAMGALAEVYTELVLHAVHNEDRVKVREMFEALQYIHQRYTDKLCNLLVSEYGKSATWASAVFGSVRGFDAPTDNLIRAVAAFRDCLKSGDI